FTVWDESAVEQINKLMGRRVNLHYEQRVGLPTSCFGETRYYVTQVTLVEEIPLAPGVVVPTPVPAPAAPSATPPQGDDRGGEADVQRFNPMDAEFLVDPYPS